ncbi:putative MFS family arabinose efflux permease [Kitasatospora sp. MAP12-15]|uniref:MFS transporter n=1 Tax=unclassified Kitasatospora TaxID=2633591 RepID=UPI002474BE63|nr:MFS transporter [Kitasatospora sp. MAP12-44]MDH6111158.1 putative MFS family arabinose efflux permease [Kitasatospora sp. MAP12-44]
MSTEVTARLRQARTALLVSFLLQGTTFALLVTRIPGIQRRYGLSDGTLTIFLAAVPILAGVGSITSEQIVKRTSPRTVLRIVQPAVCLTLVGVGAGDRLWALGLALSAFGLLVGALDASMNMLGVGLQHRYGRSIMLGFHAAFSLGGIIGALLASAGAHLPLLTLFGASAAVLIPAALVAGRFFAGPAELGDAVREAALAAARSIPWRPLLPLCAAMAFAYIADSTVSNWSAKYLTETLHSSDQVAALAYAGYMVALLLGRTVGDRTVQRWGAVAVVRTGAGVAALGFAVAALAPAAWAGIAGFTVLGIGICAIIPQVFAAGGRLFPQDSDAAVARLNLFNYVGFLVGSPLVGAIAGASSYRWALIAPMLLVLMVVPLAGHFAPTQVHQLPLDHAPSRA